MLHVWYVHTITITLWAPPHSPARLCNSGCASEGDCSGPVGDVGKGAGWRFAVKSKLIRHIPTSSVLHPREERANGALYRRV